jgi:hypothetical protein
MAEDACGNKRKNQRSLTIRRMWAKMNSVLPPDPDLSGVSVFLSAIVGLWRSWERVPALPGRSFGSSFYEVGLWRSWERPGLAGKVVRFEFLQSGPVAQLGARPGLAGKVVRFEFLSLCLPFTFC